MSRLDAPAQALTSWLSAAMAPLARCAAPYMSPDALSAARALLAVPIATALVQGWPADAALVLYVIAWLTDLLDGSIARERARLGYPGDADRGELLDTVADKILLLSTLGALLFCALRTSGAGLPATVEFVLLLGEGYLLGKRLADYRQGTRAYPSMPLGKFKVGLQVLAMALLITGELAPLPQLVWAGTSLLAASLPLMAMSIIAKHRRR